MTGAEAAALGIAAAKLVETMIQAGTNAADAIAHIERITQSYAARAHGDAAFSDAFAEKFGKKP